ncbi:flagellar export chaperone FlgN [Hippea alviniae]|uniref:flagellar export chaperone FlgN n=1 Tax=Hippea alviniae TaxID=1279027 RepID=UPI0003B75D2D|nr:flagellar export chaperone FlgN [Hippea alviniae]
MNDAVLCQLKEILSNLIKGYEKMIEIAEKERKHLIEVDSDKMVEVIQEKEKLINELIKSEEKLKQLLDIYNVDSINEFLFFASENNFVDDLRVLNGKLKEKIKEFKIKEEVNRMIATEHLRFFSGLLNVYANLLTGENYDKNATRNIKTNIMSVRV